MSAPASRPQSDSGPAASVVEGRAAHRRPGVIAGRQRYRPGRAPPAEALAGTPLHQAAVANAPCDFRYLDRAHGATSCSIRSFAPSRP
jgi:hypothetical protein